MSKVLNLVLALALSLILFAQPAHSKTFRWAFQSDVPSLDPHSIDTSFTMSWYHNVFESLVGHGPNLEVTPALATSWELVEPTKWVYYLRKGVKFHEGQDFTADDVVFSFKRQSASNSPTRSSAVYANEVRKIDDYTVEFMTPTPNPVFPMKMADLLIMDKEWCEEHGIPGYSTAEEAAKPNYATMHANGTGPFMVVSRKPDEKTVLRINPNYWGKNQISTNVTEAIFTPIGKESTRVAALLSGEVDMVYPVPVQDWRRLEALKNVELLRGMEGRVFFIGFNQSRDELRYCSVKGKNPFRDIRVRQAIAHGIDGEAIVKKVFRGGATRRGILMTPEAPEYSKELDVPYAFDIAKAKKLLAEAGYSDGFEVTLDTPNDRYFNDEKTALAIGVTLARIGIKVNVNSMTKSKYFAKVMLPKNDTSFFVIAWGMSWDPQKHVDNLYTTRGIDKLGVWNLMGYSNPRVDELSIKIVSEMDLNKRTAMIREATKIVHDEVPIVPVVQLPQSWACRKGIKLIPRVNDYLLLQDVVMP